MPLASIIIDNYNYERYIRETIDSAVAQTYPEKEIIVVDDGSTDNSRAIIESYGEKVIPVFKENGGQASAFNAGFEVSKGDIIFFLDSDDVLIEDAVKNAIELFEPGVSKVHWPLWIIDENGNKTGGSKPGGKLEEGNLKDVILKGGPTTYISSPTSGNAWSRNFLTKVCPLPDNVPYYKTCADEYLYTLAPVFGLIKAIHEPQGFYRIHGRNIYSALSPEHKLKLELEGHGQQTKALSETLIRNGYTVDTELWKINSWFHILEKGILTIRSYIPKGNKFILVDENTWNAEEHFEKGVVIPFLENNGLYAGSPQDDKLAIKELNRLIRTGVTYLVIAKPSFWWLEHYIEFSSYLQSNFECSYSDEILIIYDLNNSINEKATC